MVKNPPEMQDTGVQSQGPEHLLEKELATHSSAWRIPWTEEPDSPLGYKESDRFECLTLSLSKYKGFCFFLDSQGIIGLFVFLFAEFFCFFLFPVILNDTK